MNLAQRLEAWRRSRNWVAVGNLGEQVTYRLLESLDYQVLGTQDDYLGMVPEVLGDAVTAHPEDFIAIDPEGRLLTVNSKATAARRSCRITRDGHLTAPRVGRSQAATDYSTLRAGLVSPLEGDSYAQVVKVDLLNLRAQIFEIETTGRLTRVGHPLDIAAMVSEILTEYPDTMPPPASGADSEATAFDFTAALWLYQAGAGSWHFVTVPQDLSDEIAERTAGLRAGFGSVKVRAVLGGTSFDTSVFPSTEHGAFILPVKKAVRTAEQLSAGDTVRVQLHLRHV